MVFWSKFRFILFFLVSDSFEASLSMPHAAVCSQGLKYAHFGLKPGNWLQTDLFLVFSFEFAKVFRVSPCACMLLGNWIIYYSVVTTDLRRWRIVICVDFHLYFGLISSSDINYDWKAIIRISFMIEIVSARGELHWLPFGLWKLILNRPFSKSFTWSHEFVAVGITFLGAVHFQYIT